MLHFYLTETQQIAHITMPVFLCATIVRTICLFARVSRYVNLSGMVFFEMKGDKMPTIREMRMKLDLSQPELGKLAGVSGMTIFRVEHGEPMKKKNFYRLCEALKVDPEDVEGVELFSGVKRAEKSWKTRKAKQLAAS